MKEKPEVSNRHSKSVKLKEDEESDGEEEYDEEQEGREEHEKGNYDENPGKSDWKQSLANIFFGTEYEYEYIRNALFNTNMNTNIFGIIL